jgi:hypothetical protein
MKTTTLLASALLAAVAFSAGCNEKAMSAKAIDPASVPASVLADAHLKPGVEVIGAEERSYKNGTKMYLLRYKTADGITDTVEVNADKTVTAKPVFETK